MWDKKFSWGLALASVIALGTPADAAQVVRSISIIDPGFEALALADGAYSGFQQASSAGWRGDGGQQGFQNPTNNVFAAVPEGLQVGYVGSFDGTRFGAPNSGSFSQILNESLAVDTLYTLSVDVGRRLDVASLGLFSVELYTASAVLASGTFTDSDIASGAFRTLTLTYNSSATIAPDLIGIRFRSIYDPAQGEEYRQANFDNVRLTATTDTIMAVPEPSTWAMAIVGMGYVGGTLRRRSRYQIARA